MNRQKGTIGWYDRISSQEILLLKIQDFLLYGGMLFIPDFEQCISFLIIARLAEAQETGYAYRFIRQPVSVIIIEL